MARENITHVLADKVTNGRMTENQAVDVAERLLGGNTRCIFSLE